MSEGGSDSPQMAAEPDGSALWRTFAAAGPTANAEALTVEDFGRLHIPGKIELFLSEQVRAGRSVVLTGIVSRQVV